MIFYFNHWVSLRPLRIFSFACPYKKVTFGRAYSAWNISMASHSPLQALEFGIFFWDFLRYYFGTLYISHNHHAKPKNQLKIKKINWKLFFSWFQINYKIATIRRNPLPACITILKAEKNQHRSTVDFQIKENKNV